MYCIVIWNAEENRWHFFTNEFWQSRKEAETYVKQNKFKKSVQWKVLWYDPKYKIGITK